MGHFMCKCLCLAVNGYISAACVAQFADGAFDVVVDKGGLDALMGEDTPGSEEAGGKLLAEVARLLAPEEGAAYLCVTLAQPHVLRESLVWLSPPRPNALPCVQEDDRMLPGVEESAH